MKKTKNQLQNLFCCPYDYSKLVLYKKRSNEIFYKCVICERTYPSLSGSFNFLPDGLREWTTKKHKIKNLKVSKKSDFSGSWKPGFRGWSPSTAIKMLSLGVGEGRLGSVSKGSILDVGCGDVAKGDVNTDVYIPSPLPKNFVLASAEQLPFKDKAFDVVRSAYVIEHNLYPTEMIKEHYRVCRKKVEIFTDNSDWIGVYVYRLLNIGSIFHDEHYFKWSKEYFQNILRRLSLHGKVKVFNTSPSFLVKGLSLLGTLPRIGLIFYRDLYAEIYRKKSKTSSTK